MYNYFLYVYPLHKVLLRENKIKYISKKNHNIFSVPFLIRALFFSRFFVVFMSYFHFLDMTIQDHSIIRLMTQLPHIVIYHDHNKILPYQESFHGVLLFADVSGNFFSRRYCLSIFNTTFIKVYICVTMNVYSFW